MNCLRVEELTFSYSDQLVLDSISLNLRAGEVFVLLGANGSGKTTLLKMLARQLLPDKGEILINDREISNFSRRRLAQSIAYMPQEEDRSTALRVIDVVRLGRTPHAGWWLPMTSQDEAVVCQSLEAVGLSTMHEHPITQLSGGQWRRMILARALAQASPILLLDEPTAGLDLKYQFDVLSRVRSMAKLRSLVVVLTLHDLNQAAMFGDRLALLHDHKILSTGTAREVLRPELIEQAFGVAVSVIEHPVHRTPFVVPLYRDEEIAAAQSSDMTAPREAKP